MKTRHEFTGKVVRRATKAEIAARIEVIVPMILDGLRPARFVSWWPTRRPGVGRSQRRS